MQVKEAEGCRRMSGVAVLKAELMSMGSVGRSFPHPAQMLQGGARTHCR